MKKILNKLAILAVATTFFSNVASAEIKAGPVTITPGILVESQKIGEWNGLVANRNQPSVGVDLNLSHASGLYIYSALKQDRNDPQESASGTIDYEFCNSVGFANKINKLSYDLSFENCNYEGQIEQENLGTYVARASYAVNDKTIIGAAYAQNDTDGDISNNERIKFADFAYKLYATYNVGFADATITYGETEDLTKYYKAGLAKSYAGINFDLSYWNVYDVAAWVDRANPINNFETDHLVLTAKKTF
jgi:hypothetical protein